MLIKKIQLIQQILVYMLFLVNCFLKILSIFLELIIIVTVLIKIMNFIIVGHYWKRIKIKYKLKIIWSNWLLRLIMSFVKLRKKVQILFVTKKHFYRKWVKENINFNQTKMKRCNSLLYLDMWLLKIMMNWILIDKQIVLRKILKC